MINLSSKLQELRQSRGITQKDIAEAIYITTSSYQRYEYGKREPSLQEIVKIADFFKVSIDYLVGRTDNPDMNR